MAWLVNNEGELGKKPRIFWSKKNRWWLISYPTGDGINATCWAVWKWDGAVNFLSWLYYEGLVPNGRDE